MKKILTMIPAGEVYNHDNVRWYQAHDIQRSIDQYHNIGDAFVHDSSLKLLQFDSVEPLNIRSTSRQEVERYNAEYAFCFLRGSNYINESMSWGHTEEILRTLRIPVLAFGIGAQAPSHGPLRLSDESKRVLALIADHCTTIGVRGTYTAEVLAEIGVKNTRIIGCPTLFRHKNPGLRINLQPLERIARVGFTLRREVSATYARDVARYNAVQKEAMVALANRFRLTVLSQGEIEEKKIVFGTLDQRRDGFHALANEGWLSGPTDPVAELYRSRLFYSDVVADYDHIVRMHDLVLGYRLHGNLMALANGVPAIYFTYDSRTEEFVKTFAIPSFDVFGDEPFVLEKYWDQSFFDAFNAAYQRGYREMRTFLSENGVDHRMPDETQTQPAAATDTTSAPAQAEVITLRPAANAAVETAQVGGDAATPTADQADPEARPAAAETSAGHSDGGEACPSVVASDEADVLPAHAIEGYIDFIDGRRLFGWAWCRGRPTTRVIVEIRYGERPLTRVRADRLRPDLTRAGVSDGRYAFDVSLDEPIPDDDKGAISAVVCCGPDGPFAPLVNRTVKAPAKGAASAEKPAAGDATPSADAPRVPQASVAAVLRAVDERLRSLGQELRSDLRTVVADRPEAEATVLRSIESRLEQLSATQDALGRQLSAMEIFQARFDATLAAAGALPKAGGAGTAAAGTDRWLVIAVAALSVLSSASLVIGLISVFR